MARDNRTLGKFHLDGIPPAPRGVPQVEVTFDIDANGILHVNAKDKATSKEQKIRITASSGLSDQEIDRMVKEAREHESEDRRKKELIETRNTAEAAVYQTEKLLREHREKLDPKDVSNVELAMEDVRTQLKGEDAAAMKAAVERLQTAQHKIAEVMYAQGAGGGEAGPQAPAGGAPGAEPKGGKSDDVIDAEFEDAN
jgi:molecular chaperone DnaK